MVCPNCGAQVPNNVAFCSKCGVRLQQQPTQQPVYQQPVYQQPMPYQQPAQQRGMRCPKCGSNNVIVQAVTNVKTKHRGCLAWCGWLLLACFTLGLILIIPLITNSKTKSKTHSEAVCQTCGKRWKV